MMKTISRVIVILMLFVSFGEAATLADITNKVFEFLDDGTVKGIAGLLIAAASLTIAFGNVEKGKGLLWCVVIGIGLLYSAKTISESIF